MKKRFSNLEKMFLKYEKWVFESRKSVSNMKKRFSNMENMFLES